MSLMRNIPSRLSAFRSIRCMFSTEAGNDSSATSTPPPQPAAAPKPTTPAPSDNSKYGCQLYYGHNEMSFYDIDVAMSDKRVGQPSSKQK